MTDTEEPAQPRRRPQSVLRDRTETPSKLAEIRQASTWRDWIEGQPQNLGMTILMAAGAFAMLSRPQDAPHFLGLTAAGWAEIAVVLAVLHQLIVALVFRLQLHRDLFTKLFEHRDITAWTWIFTPLLVARPLLLILVGLADVPGLTGLRPLDWLIGIGLLGAAGWGMYSVFRHFHFLRAIGGDHFREEIAAMPLVREGAFAHVENVMYGIVFLGLWGIAFLFGSWNALVVALFQHAYIWVHMYCTETPDMGWLYGDRLAKAKQSD